MFQQIIKKILMKTSKYLLFAFFLFPIVCHSISVWTQSSFSCSISQLAISICVTVYYILIFEYAPTEYQAIRMKISLKNMKISPKCQTWVKVFIKLILNSYLWKSFLSFFLWWWLINLLLQIRGQTGEITPSRGLTNRKSHLSSTLLPSLLV